MNTARSRLSARSRSGAMLVTLMVTVVLTVVPVSAQVQNAVAEAVLGQPDFSSIQCNHGGLGPRSLCSPSALAVDPETGRLYASDRENNCVLSWQMPDGSRAGMPPTWCWANLISRQVPVTAARWPAGCWMVAVYVVRMV
jgi:hypothetical protein